MAEWKTDTEEVRQIVKACRDFKRSLQEERCAQFIKDLDAYARGILVERRKIERKLEEAINGLREAKKKKKSFWRSFLKGAKDVCEGISNFFPPAKLGVAVCDKALNRMEENTEKWEKNVELLEQALEIYSIQAKASVELVKGAWESVKKSLDFYTDKHQEFIKRLNQASEAIDNEYNIVPPESLKERDFESPKIAYSPKKAFLMSGVHSYDESFLLAKKHCVKNIKEALEGFTKKIKKSPNDLNAMNEAFNRLKTELERVSDDERLKGLRENLASLYADLKDRFNASSKSDRTKASKEHGLDLMSGTHSYDESFLLAKKDCVKNFKKALQDFAEKIKKSPNDLNAMNEAFDNLETELERATENLSQKIAPILERYENDKHHALGYGEFLEKEKESFIIDEQNPYPEEVRFNELRLAEFDSVFSAIVPLEDLEKPYALTMP
ncbi:HNH endonuclease [Helicobacter pylori]|uniref:HNH endonuclease n=1 Tax=Helicobacter pylori TaxID=210 RepID=UPI0026CB50B1